MPVVGLSSKLQQPAVGSRPFHPAAPIPNLDRTARLRGRVPGTAASRRPGPPPAQSCQLSLKSPCGYQERVTPLGRDKDSEDSKVSKVSGVSPCISLPFTPSVGTCRHTTVALVRIARPAHPQNPFPNTPGLNIHSESAWQPLSTLNALTRSAVPDSGRQVAEFFEKAV
ncbi:hypothetical protein SKAU_G00021940 [Synaphobranchus kaupii]|uniref:Uncharacterized protein n=1 Tax=Synaphobranchus kaupii TaxID=118154 RepID=A0A9Q1JCA6_SYNKA|nr:hypothetical protein SKAU_G00021940 [Synaphobranchus kaupii]